jgi:hypothetical protein
VYNQKTKIRALAIELLAGPARTRILYPDGSVNKSALHREILAREFSAQAVESMSDHGAVEYRKHKGWHSVRNASPGKHSGYRKEPG